MVSKNLKDLEKYRTMQRYTKQELARQSGVNARTIEQIEKGEQTNPQIDTLIALCDVLKIPLSKLVK